MCAYISFPVYLSTDSGSLDENLPPLLNTDGDSLLLLPNNKSKSKPSRIRLTFGSRTTGNLTGVLSRLCPLYPHTLLGVSRVDVKANLMPESRLAELTQDVGAGGRWKPSTCLARQRLAVIIPHRDRAAHLRLLLFYLHPFLQRQMRHYQIFVVEQAYNETFNKGVIMNMAFNEVMRRGHWDCIVFHDVDMIPQNDRNIYECTRQPRHLSPGLDEMRFTLLYWGLVGGALALTPAQVVHTNGYSNMYWGWGGEDDDMFTRIEGAGYVVTRPSNHIGRYKMVRHKKRKGEAQRYDLLDLWRRWPLDGLNSLANYNLTVLAVTEHSLYTNFTVDIGKPPPSLFQEAIAMARATSKPTTDRLRTGS
ncbi:Beta-1,4-galactosyltransferase 3 [Lamellibrachia satsuma]|nr:Beta-1,4-galactosyltransferase 3 [Lamellibrachia satsuma]